MSLVSNTQLLATRIGEEIKTVRAEASAIAAARYTKAEADAKIAAAIADVLNGAPGALDTLNELAAALGNDANFASTITNQLALKANAADVEASLALKADADAVYTIEETDSAITDAIDALASVDAGAYSSTDVAVYQDSSRTPQADPLGIGGWYFKNISAGQKINWYPYSGGATVNGSPRVEELTSIWAVVNFYNTTSNFIFGLYSKKTGSGDAGSWYKSRWVRATKVGTIPASPVAGQPVKMLVYWGTDPGVRPELPRLQIGDTLEFNSVGPRLGTEEILTYSWGTDSSMGVNKNEFTVEQLGHKMGDQLFARSLVHVGASLADLALKANTADVYTKAAVDSALALKADASAVYTEAEVDSLLNSLRNEIGDMSANFVMTFEAALEDAVPAGGGGVTPGGTTPGVII